LEESEVNGQIPHTLGAGKRITLNRMSLPVNVAKSAPQGSALLVGAVPDSPIGPKVVVGIVAMSPEDVDARTLLAHLSVDEATELATQLLLAASVIADTQQH
jgi:hypothetical protein